jgi:nucleotide-binding universal stress UspA family protein
MLKKILVAVDASERAPGVFDAAAELALKFAAKLYSVQVITIPPEFPAAAEAIEADALPAHLTRLAHAQLSELPKRAPGLLATTPIVVSGEPWRLILETAQRLDVDLIVLGSHGYHGWDHVLGTTAGKVANRAKRNVLVVHQHTPEAVAVERRMRA